MVSALRINPKCVNTLSHKNALFTVFFLFISGGVFAQDNSPYSRYGIGDLSPSNNIINRAMGGMGVGYIDGFSINFSNPASYSSFYAEKEQKSGKLTAGRAILDLGINFEGRKLTEPGNPNTYKSNNALFSYVQIGVPLKQNWGLNFGLRPVSRIGYKVYRREVLKDPLTGQRIDSAETLFEGTGGAYLPSIGTGFAIFKRVKHDQFEKLSLGLNMGYLFGEKDYSTRRRLINDSVEYYAANHETQTNFNGMYFTAGLQYILPVKKNTYISVGAALNWGQNLDASQDILRETFFYDANQGNTRLDSVSDRRNIKGVLRMPSMYTLGVLMQKYPIANKESGWLLGIDYAKQNWSGYRLYGQVDSVRDKWDLRVGGQFNPVPRRNFFSNVSYRAGFSMGPEYIRVRNKLSVWSATFGLGLPVAYSRQAPNQRTIVNVAFEYNKRGNEQNILRENMYRLSFGFALSDFWFIKRRYD